MLFHFFNTVIYFDLFANTPFLVEVDLVLAIQFS